MFTIRTLNINIVSREN